MQYEIGDIEVRWKLTVVGVVNVGDIAPSIVRDDGERGAVEQRSKVDREASGRRRAVRGRGRGGVRAAVAGVPRQQRVVDRRAGRHVRHVERPSERVDGRASRLVGEAEQREDTVGDRRAYFTRHNTTQHNTI